MLRLYTKQVTLIICLVEITGTFSQVVVQNQNYYRFWQDGSWKQSSVLKYKYVWYSLLYAPWGWIVFRFLPLRETEDLWHAKFVLFSFHSLYNISLNHLYHVTIGRYKDLIKTFRDMSALYTFRCCYMWYFSIKGTGQVLNFKIVSEMHSRSFFSLAYESVIFRILLPPLIQ